MNNDYKHLTAWCDEYSKKTGLKIYPQSAPLQLVLEDVVGHMVSLRKYHDNLVSIYNSLNQRVTAIEEKLANQKPKINKKEVKK